MGIEPNFQNISLFQISADLSPGEIIERHNLKPGIQYGAEPLPDRWSQLPYTVTIYSGRSAPQSSFGAALAAAQGEEATESVGATVSYVCFLVRDAPKELFAFTTNQGYRVVQSHASYAFPRRVASRLMEPRLLTLQSRPLVGNRHATEAHYRVGREETLDALQWDSLWCLYRNFSGSFKTDSSIGQIWRPDGGGAAAAPRLTAEVRNCHLHLSAPLTMPTLHRLAELFGKIGRGEPTAWESGGEQVEDRDEIAFEALEQIQPVLDPELLERLNGELVGHLVRVCQEGGEAPPFSLAPAAFHDYYSAPSFSLESGGTSSVHFYPPSIDDLMGWLRTFSTAHSLRLRNGKLRFGQRSVSIIGALQGELLLDDRLYFRADGQWLQVNGDQPALLQAEFEALVQRHLMRMESPANLQKAWLKNPEDASFSVEDVEEDLEELERDARFSFLDGGGVVQIPYATRILAEGPHRRLIKKRMGALSALLAEQVGKQLTLEQLRVLFRENGVAEGLLEQLQKRHPTVVRFQKSIRAVDDAGNILVPMADWPRLPRAARTIPGYVRQVESMHAADPSRAFSIFRANGSSPLSPTAIKTLQVAKRVTQYYAQGPYPGLEVQHNRYRQIADEEGYNRSYMGEPGFLVLDQVIVENLELCDLLYQGEEDRLYLYHVKRGVGQPTGAACSQIRGAARRLRAALAAEGQPMLKRLYQAMVGDAGSQFRRDLKREAEKMSEAEFVSLFSRRITYVYAFLDDSAIERDLSQDPAKFASVYAKVELRTLAGELDGLGFDFQICQIRRDGRLGAADENPAGAGAGAGIDG